MKAFKNLLLVFLFISFASCFEKDIEIIDTEEENTLHKNSALSVLMSSVTSHNASFDDLIDGSDCFSLIFPYNLLVNGEQITITSINDINLIHDEDEIEILFPVSIAFVDYDIRVLQNVAQFNTVFASCQNGELFNFHIDCAEFVFPFSYAKYNTITRNFDLVNMTSREQAFQFLANLKEDEIFVVNYPLNIILYNNDHYTVHGNQVLSHHFVSASLVCD